MKKFFKRVNLTMLFLFISVFMVGCVSKEEKKEVKSETRKVSHLKGETEIPTNPKRIADVSGAAEELILMGLTPIAAANTEKGVLFPHLKERLPEVEVVGNAWGDAIDIEKVAKTNPDLIILNNRQEKIYDQLSKIAPTVMLKSDMDKWRDKFQELGGILGKEKEVEKAIKNYDDKTATVAAGLKDKIKGEKFMFLGITPKGYRIYGSYGYADILFNDLKLPYVEGTPIDKALEQVSLEALAKFDSDYIFLVSFGGEADRMLKELEESSVWKNLKAVKSGKVHVLSYSDFLSKSFAPIGKEMIVDDIAKVLEKTYK